MSGCEFRSGSAYFSILFLRSVVSVGSTGYEITASNQAYVLTLKYTVGGYVWCGILVCLSLKSVMAASIRQFSTNLRSLVYDICIAVSFHINGLNCPE